MWSIARALAMEGWMKASFTRSARTSRNVASIVIGVAALGLVTGCGGGKSAGKTPGAKGPPTVGYVVVQPTRVASMTDLAGRTSAYQTSEVRPQVSGIVRRRFFVEGSLVHKGQTLYQIDPSLYQASVDEARANLSSAQAIAQATRVRADRYKPLADIQAVAKQDYTDAAAQASQAGASVQQNRAALETARINLHYTTVPAPITGRIGRSLFTVGALVTASQTDPLTTIQQLDPMYVDIQQSSADLLALRHALASGGVVPASAVVRLKLEDGSDYAQTGTVEFAEAMVDENTGTVTLRARFPNPQGLLLPGMFVRAIFAQSVDANAFLVPQAAVSRDPQGAATVYVLTPDNKAAQRSVKADRTEGAFWVVTGGLAPGDKVLVQGISRLKPNQPNQVVKPVPANTPQRLVPPQQDKGGAGGSGGGGSGKGG